MIAAHSHKTITENTNMTSYVKAGLIALVAVAIASRIAPVRAFVFGQ